MRSAAPGTQIVRIVLTLIEVERFASDGRPADVPPVLEQRQQRLGLPFGCQEVGNAHHA